VTLPLLAGVLALPRQALACPSPGTTDPPPGPITLGVVSVNGTGCPRGTVEAVPGATAGPSFTFHAFRARAGGCISVESAAITRLRWRRCYYCNGGYCTLRAGRQKMPPPT